MMISLPKKTKALIIFFLFFWNFASKANPIDSALIKSQYYLDHSKLDSAELSLNYLNEKLDIDKASKELCQFYRIKADLYFKREDFSNQLNFKKLALEIAEKLKDKSLQADIYIDLASYYETILEIKNSIPYLLKAQEIYTELNIKDRLALVYSKLGLLHYEEDNFNQALTYFFGSFVIFNEIRDEKPEYAYWVQNNLLNIGLCHQQLFNPRKALAYFKIALAFCQNAKFEQERPIGVISTNIGAIYGELKQYKIAYEYLNKGLAVCLKPEKNELYHGVQTIIFIATLKSIEGESTESTNLFKRSKFLIDSLHFGDLNEYWLVQLSKHYARQKKFEDAYVTKLLHLQFKDSVNKVTGRNTLSRQMLIYKLGQEKAENDLLIEQSKNSNLITIGISGLVIFLIITQIIAIYFYRKIKNNNARLQEMNKQIMQQKFSLEALNHQLLQANDNKTYLIKTIAHDLRTPIGNLVSLQSLLDEYIQKSPESEEYQKLISSSCFMAMHIIEDILDQSVIEKGILTLSMENILINPIINDTINLLRFRFEPKQIQVVTLLEEEIRISIDGERIKRVIINILMNAIKFSPRKSVIHIKLFQKQDKCLLSISDQGIGMTKDVINKLFDKHQKIGRVGLEKEKSFGIGLTISQSIIEAHGGKIFVESQPNYGSTFYIELPLYNSEA